MSTVPYVQPIMYSDREVLKIRSRDDGEENSYGFVMARKDIGTSILYLSLDEERGCFWVAVVREGKSHSMLGYREGRRYDAYAAFLECHTLADIDQLVALNPVHQG